jgi:hypothetical protein
VTAGLIEESMGLCLVMWSLTLEMLATLMRNRIVWSGDARAAPILNEGKLLGLTERLLVSTTAVLA